MGLAWASPAAAETTGAIDLGLRVAAALPVGQWQQDQPLAHLQTLAIPLQFDANYRLSHRLRVGLSLAYAYGVPATPAGSAGVHSEAASAVRVMASAHYHTAPFASIDPWFGASLGVNWMRGQRSVETLGAFDRTATSVTVPLIDLQGGVQWKLTPDLYLGPYVSVCVGQASSVDTTTGSGVVAQTTSQPIPTGQRTVHLWLVAGVALQYSL
jgi:outer membrane protein